MKLNTFIILTILFCGCRAYDKKDFDFNDKELKHFSEYSIGDTVYFQSNLGDMDAIIIVDFKTESENGVGFIAPKPSNGKWVQIKHVQIDQWQETLQELFWITKFPTDQKTEYCISYKDFNSMSDTIIGEYNSDPLTLNDITFSNYYVVKHGFPERVIEPKNIETVYWSDKYGLIAYRSKDGETWTKKSN